MLDSNEVYIRLLKGIKNVRDEIKIEKIIAFKLFVFRSILSNHLLPFTDQDVNLFECVKLQDVTLIPLLNALDKVVSFVLE